MNTTATIAAKTGTLVFAHPNARRMGSSDDVAIDVILRVAAGALNASQAVRLGATAAAAAEGVSAPATASAFPLATADGLLYVTLEAGEAIYAASDSGTVGVYALTSRR